MADQDNGPQNSDGTAHEDRGLQVTRPELLAIALIARKALTEAAICVGPEPDKQYQEMVAELLDEARNIADLKIATATIDVLIRFLPEELDLFVDVRH